MKHLFCLLFIIAIPFLLLAQSPSKNYVKNTIPQVEVQTEAGLQSLSEEDKIESIIYFDGLGRAIQSIAKQAGGQKQDIITPIIYDAFGRQLREYLPYSRSDSSLLMETSLDADIYGNIPTLNTFYSERYPSEWNQEGDIPNPFSLKKFEKSPLGRVLELAAPGKDWSMDNNHTIKFAYETNGFEEVKQFSVHHPNNNTEKTNLILEDYYIQNQLYKTITKDENWQPNQQYDKDHTTEEFKNKQGQVILKRTYNNNELHDTYYVYDDYGNLTYVLPPEASEDITRTGNLGFRAASQTNYSWINLVSVDKEFADDYNKHLIDYDNQSLLNADIENKYGGQGGFTVTTFTDSDHITLSINFSAIEHLELKQGELISLKDYGEYKDTELGVLKGPEHEYYFTIRKNAIYIEGKGKINAISQTFSSSQVLDYSLDYTWPMLVDVDSKYAYEFDKEIRGYANEFDLNPLDVYIENEFGAQGGLEVLVDVNDNVSFNFNISANAALHLRKDFSVKLDLKRKLKDRDLGTITGQGFGYDFALKENTLYAWANETASFTAFNGFTFSSGQTLVELHRETVEGLCYIYHYDSRNRLIEKKIPGKGWEYIVYDKLDRPILTQDAKQRLKYKWLYTKYDVFGRVIYTGSYKFGARGLAENSSRLELQDDANAETMLYENDGSTTIDGHNIKYTNQVMPTDDIELFTVNYYDDYNFNMPNGVDYVDHYSLINTKSLPTASQVKVLNTNKWITTVTYYDKKAQPVLVASNNKYLNTLDVVEYDLDFTGKPTSVKNSHSKDGNGTLVVKSNFTYDHTGRLLTETQEIENRDKELIVKNHYDELGQLDYKKVGGKVLNSSELPNGLQTVNYDYNIRGWLKRINNGNADANNLFGFKINYNTTDLPGATALFNGNISETHWQVNGENGNTIDKAYGYRYDALNRIKSGDFHKLSEGAAEDYSMGKVLYDKNGNIAHLMRTGMVVNEGSTQDAVPDYIDILTYSYEPKSNQLNNVHDDATKDGFKDGRNEENDYLYDINGNMTQDLNKGIIHIEYNHLNLPIKIVIEGDDEHGTIGYVYDATGVKLEKQVTDDNVAASKTTDYAGNYIYENDVLKFFSTSEGYVEPSEVEGFNYVYQYKDHLNNIRLSYSDSNNDGSIDANTEIISEKSYYPFGLEHRGYNNVVSANANSVAEKFKYNGVELEESLGLNLYEMDFRQYDPAIARFTSIDPITHFANSTYTAFDNNPVVWADPSGLDSESFVMDLFNRSSSGEKWTNNNNGTFSSSTGQSADCDECPNIQLYEIGKYNNTLPEYDGSVGSKSFNIAGGYSATPYLKDGEVVAYGVGRDGRLEYIVAAGSLGVFQENVVIYTTASNLFYINGYAPDENTIALSQGNLSGLVGMWKQALSSPAYYLYAATVIVSGANVAINEAAVAKNLRRFTKKVPTNAKSSVTINRLGNSGNSLMEATSAGKVPGSSAVYRKWVNNKGETFRMTKTTYAPDGSIIHVKSKF